MTNTLQPLIVGCYWLFGIYFCVRWYRVQGKDFTLAHLFVTVAMSAWVWPVPIFLYVLARAQDIILFKGKEPKQ